MKNKNLVFILTLVIFSYLLLACDDNKGSKENLVEFTLNNTKYTLTKGVKTSVEIDGVLVSSDGESPQGMVEENNGEDSHLVMQAFLNVIDDESSSEPSYPFLYLGVDDASDTGSYTLNDSDSNFVIRFEEYNYDLDSDNSDEVILVITHFGDIGGYIEGTFSGTVTQNKDGKKYTLSNGKFRVVRVPDGIISF